MAARVLFLVSLLVASSSAFPWAMYHSRGHASNFALSMTDNVEAETTTVSIDPKEAVKLFGRLAEKYIMLDSSGGMCCYSACSDCEYRLPDGGYRMADQSASRPKWIPVYTEQNFAATGKEHTSKWSTEIFKAGPAVSKEEFIEALLEMSYAPPLGGPYVSASAAKLEDTTAASYLFDRLAGGKDVLTRYRMHLELKELSGGEASVTWPKFSEFLNI